MGWTCQPHHAVTQSITSNSLRLNCITQSSQWNYNSDNDNDNDNVVTKVHGNDNGNDIIHLMSDPKGNS